MPLEAMPCVVWIETSEPVADAVPIHVVRRPTSDSNPTDTVPCVEAVSGISTSVTDSTVPKYIVSGFPARTGKVEDGAATVAKSDSGVGGASASSCSDVADDDDGGPGG